MLNRYLKVIFMFFILAMSLNIQAKEKDEKQNSKVEVNDNVGKNQYTPVMERKYLPRKYMNIETEEEKTGRGTNKEESEKIKRILRKIQLNNSRIVDQKADVTMTMNLPGGKEMVNRSKYIIKGNKIKVESLENGTSSTMVMDGNSIKTKKGNEKVKNANTNLLF